jgi:hypothetical protein
MKRRHAKALLTGLSLVLALASLAYAATFWADREYPYIVSGYSDLVLDGNTATAHSVTYTDYNEPYDELRAHCQLWEDGHFLDSQTEIIETFGWRLIYSYGDGEPEDALEETSSYDGNFWVYGVHRGILYSMDNDITSDGYLSISKRGNGVDLQEWNTMSMAIARTYSGNGAILVPWYKLNALKSILGQAVGGELMITVIDGVMPLLNKGDLFPTVAVDREAGSATVVVPLENGGHRVIMFEFPKDDAIKAGDSV